MTQDIIAIFENNRIANEAFQFLQMLGTTWYFYPAITNDNKEQSEHVTVRISVELDQIIAIYEIVRSFSGEITTTPYFEEVIQKMYNIPEESYENDANDALDNEHEIGTLGYPFDLLNDDAYIDPNIGLGDHDLLTPFMEPSADKQQ